MLMKWIKNNKPVLGVGTEKRVRTSVRPEGGVDKKVVSTQLVPAFDTVREHSSVRTTFKLRKCNPGSEVRTAGQEHVVVYLGNHCNPF